jgi:hypothetical protein
MHQADEVTEESNGINLALNSPSIGVTRSFDCWQTKTGEFLKPVHPMKLKLTFGSTLLSQDFFQNSSTERDSLSRTLNQASFFSVKACALENVL